MADRLTVHRITQKGDPLTRFCVLDAEPLGDIRNISKIHRVIKGGVIYDPAQLLVANR